MKNNKGKKLKKGLVFVLKSEKNMYPDKKAMKVFRSFLREITPKGYSFIVSPCSIELQNIIDIKTN